jgi:hypothetical protein
MQPDAASPRTATFIDNVIRDSVEATVAGPLDSLAFMPTSPMPSKRRLPIREPADVRVTARSFAAPAWEKSVRHPPPDRP